MAVFRIEKTRDYTVMSNYHLRDMELSCKACGLLSKMLSLPEEWDYTTRGLARICKDGVDSIGSALKELEKRGYLVRNRLRDDKGRIRDTEYIIYETPHLPDPDPGEEAPGTTLPDMAEPDTACPDTGNPDMDRPDTEAPRLEHESLPDGGAIQFRFHAGQPLRRAGQSRYARRHIKRPVPKNEANCLCRFT